MNIATVQSKGGVTKSTIASNLSVWLHQKGHAVACVDLDGGEAANRTFTTTIAQSEPTLPLFKADTAADVRQLLPQLAEQFHFIVADAPGGFAHTHSTNLELLRHTDFALIPVTPRFGDISPLSVVEEVIDEARKINPLLEARVIINCVDGRTKTGRDPEGIIETIESVVPNLRVMRQTIRVDFGAFEYADQNGSVVVKGPRSNGRDDLNSLFGELLSDMILSINQQGQRIASRTQTMEEDDGRKAVHG